MNVYYLTNMKAIEERARKYGIEAANLLWSDCTKEQREREAKIYAMVYSKIATEQKEIDDAESGKELLYVVNKTTKRVKREMIDKACEWLINTYLGDYVTDEYGNGGIGNNVKLADDFRKAMEDTLYYDKK